MATQDAYKKLPGRVSWRFAEWSFLANTLNNEMNSSSSRQERRIRTVLVIAFVIAMLMGVGPGVYLVNRAETILGLPLLYVWALFWYAVHIVIVITAYLFLWRDDSSATGRPATGRGATGRGATGRRATGRVATGQTDDSR